MSDSRAPWPGRLRLGVDLSDLDVAIIRALQADGRAPYAAMARELGVVEKTVRRRVSDLRDRGVIEITTVADPRTLGYEASALVAVNVDNSRRATDVADDLSAIAESDHVVVTTGRFDIFVELVCRDTDHLLETIERQLRQTAGVRSVETFPYLGMLYQEPQWTTAQLKPKDGRAIRSVMQLEPNDRAILALLSDDGRMPFPHIASALGLSETQVRQRVNAMVQQGAVRIMAITNPASIGFRTSAWLAVTAQPGAPITAIAERLSSLPSIAYLAVCAGRYALFAEAVCENNEDLLRLLDEEIRPTPDVAAVEPALFLRILYKRLRPLL